MNRKTHSHDSDPDPKSIGAMPSEFMRKLRPENYSDTIERDAIELSVSELEYRLETITAVNQTHDFELFCRKLCERAICPHLRAQTGPEGGGDAKVDSETLPVAEEVRDLFFEGLANQGQEKWAFAISAEKTWSKKARRDVKAISETRRGYERIYFITSRHVRAKDRARVEDELTNTYGIPVIIHDRTWIVDETIEKDRKDLALNFLGVGRTVNDPGRMGPNDYSRTTQLEDLEKEIKNPEAFAGMEMQLVSQALVAAKVSRALERPREETDGRFMRAIRLAEKHGTYRQKLAAKYEQIWTSVWWFDDLEFLFSEYTVFETAALTSDHALDLELVGNLYQCLVNAVIHGHTSAQEAQLTARGEALSSRLHELSQDTDRPNNRLEAKAGLLRIQLNQAMLKGEESEFSKIWTQYGEIVDAARGLGEFSFDTLLLFIEATGQLAGNDPAYNALVEKIAEVMAERTSESEAALIYLRRAKLLSIEDKFDMIRWLGKAAVGLAKQEHSTALIEATYLLAVAYRSAGLLWAARASCALAMATLFIEGERDSEIPIEVVPTMKLKAWISLELGHLPDVLHAIQLLSGFKNGLPLDEASSERVQRDLYELDISLAALILNLPDADLTLLQRLPDLLNGLDMYMARTSLLFRLGHLQTMRDDGSLPDEESDEDVIELLSEIRSQPVGRGLVAPLITNADAPSVFETTILGMRVVVQFDGKELISVAEAILGALEAFFATTLEARLLPHAELYCIQLQSTEADEPVIQTSESDMTTNVKWPDRLRVGDFDQAANVRLNLTIISAHVMSATCSSGETTELMEQLLSDDAGFDRITMIGAFPNSHSRMFRSPYSQMSDWDKYDPREFELKNDRPEPPNPQVRPHPEPEPEQNPTTRPKPLSHKHISVKSVIDLPTWDKAVWRGCAVLPIGSDLPPVLALLFEEGEAGRKIFERWRARFGARDEDDAIALSIIRRIPGWHPDHYIAQITSNVEDVSADKMMAMPVRSLEVNAPNSQNLDRFLNGFERHGVFAIIPGTMPMAVGSQPDFHFDLSIEKSQINVVDAAEIHEGQIEVMSLRMRGLQPSS